MPNHSAAAVQLADLIISLTDPKITRWRKEQLEMQARQAARTYLRRLEDIAVIEKELGK